MQRDTLRLLISLPRVLFDVVWEYVKHCECQEVTANESCDYCLALAHRTQRKMNRLLNGVTGPNGQTGDMVDLKKQTYIIVPLKQHHMQKHTRKRTQKRTHR